MLATEHISCSSFFLWSNRKGQFTRWGVAPHHKGHLDSLRRSPMCVRRDTGTHRVPTIPWISGLVLIDVSKSYSVGPNRSGPRANWNLLSISTASFGYRIPAGITRMSSARFPWECLKWLFLVKQIYACIWIVHMQIFGVIHATLTRGMPYSILTPVSGLEMQTTWQ